MLTIKLKNNEEICSDIGLSFKKQRLMKNMTRQMLSNSSGVSVSTIKNFETNGKISLDSFISIIQSLNKDDLIKKMIQIEQPNTIEEFKNQTRKRARL